MEAMLERAMTQHTHVMCPICQVTLLQQDINSHIDLAHMDPVPAAPSPKRARRSCGSASSDAFTWTSPVSPSAVAGAVVPETLGEVTIVATDEQLAHMAATELDTVPQSLPSETQNAGIEPTMATDGQLDRWQPMDSWAAPEMHPVHQPLPLDNQNPGNGRNSELVIAEAEAPWGDSSRSVLEVPEASSLDLAVALQPGEHLKAHLLGSRAFALRQFVDLSSRKHADVLQLSGEVRSHIEQRRPGFEEYLGMAKPVNTVQQCARNALRGDLEEVARAERSNLKSLISASSEPTETLRAAADAHLGVIDDAMQMLQQQRADTLAVVEEYEKKEEVARQTSLDMTLSLSPSVDCLDGFMQRLSQEFHDETAKAAQAHAEKLEELRQEEMRFVKANEDRQRNPIFAKVIEDIASTERLLKEHEAQDTSQKEFLKDWNEIMESFPAQKLPPPQKPTVWGRLLGRL